MHDIMSKASVEKWIEHKRCNLKKKKIGYIFYHYLVSNKYINKL